MPTKKELSALLGETLQPPLSRGRGLRLSRTAKQARELALMPSAAPEPVPPSEPSAITAPPADDPATLADTTPLAPPGKAAAVAVPPIESVPAEPLLLKPEREKRKIQLRKDLLKQCKRIARAQDRKLYQVIEAALEEYIQRHGAAE